MDQRLLSADAHTDEAVGAVGFDGVLLGIDDAEDLDVVLGEGEVGEVRWVGVDELFGDGIEFGHGCDIALQKSCHGGGSEGRRGSAALECSGKDTGMGG